MTGYARVTGLGGVQVALARVRAQLHAAAEEATDEGAEAARAQMADAVPVDTGETLERLDVRDGETPGSKEVGFFDSEAIPFIEYGTEDTQAQPTIMPAAEAERARFPGRVAAKAKAAAR